MNDQDYIRKAVELADGWRLSNDKEPLIYLDDGTSDGISFMSWSYHQFMLDALAAQLVRQVDALDTPDTIEITHDSVWVGYRSKNNESWKRTKRTKSRDRTMNTIKAVVDSKTLELQ